MTTENAVAPTPSEIDDLCLAHDKAATEVEAARQNHSAAKAALLVVVRQFGYVPKNADKTMRLDGTLYVASSTVATIVEVVERPVAELELELSRARRAKLFVQLFDRTVKHVLKKGAAELLRISIASLPAERQAHILGIYALCMVADSKAPSLSVELAAVLQRKETEAAEKAAKKAARDAKAAAKTGGVK